MIRKNIDEEQDALAHEPKKSRIELDSKLSIDFLRRRGATILFNFCSVKTFQCAQ